ncbi:phage head closure protein [Planomicrobium okeanokoites]|uniref:phage head closure protein n=1 Tax=Planomicrobium okeanokoites TaxID=244 RepID=UPI000A063A13|nr:phage head closure protein [Planomicrobium okeanokoites]
MLQGEFPHNVTAMVSIKQKDRGAGHSLSWADSFHFSGLMDTPTSREVFNAHQRNILLDRNLFCEFRTDIKKGMRISHGDDIYEVAAVPKDQGGQGEILKIALKLVPDGG